MIYVFLANGFEEMEAVAPIDILRRAGGEVMTVGVGSKEITAAHGIRFTADITVDDIKLNDSVDMIVLPGGMPGTSHLAGSSVVAAQCRAFAADPHKWVAAICAAPSVLASLGLLQGRNATCHPLFEQQLTGAAVTHEGVTVDGNIITGRGLGSAIPFALELVKCLTDEATAEKIRAAICYNG